MNILVVDDEPAILQALRAILSRDGHAVYTAGLPCEAIERVRAADSPFGLMITDQTMPGMSGPELAREVKAISPSTSIALLTGLSPAAGTDRSACVDYVLQKPIRLADLRKFISGFAQHPAAETQAH